MSHEPITTIAIIKNLLYIPLGLLIGINPESYVILTVFMFVDLALGVMRVCVLYGCQSLKSYKFNAGLISKMLILTVPLIMVWAGRGAGFDLSTLGQWSVGALVLSQAYSMLGHINAIRSKQEKTEWDAVSFVLKKLRNGLEALLIDSHNKEDV